MTNESGVKGGVRRAQLHDGEDFLLRRVPEFVGQYQKLKDEAEAVRKREASEVIYYIVKLVALYELSIDEIAVVLNSKDPARRPKARYMDPVSGKTWSGRGRRPRWMEGRDPEEFLLPNGAE